MWTPRDGADDADLPLFRSKDLKSILVQTIGIIGQLCQALNDLDGIERSLMIQ